MGLDLSASCRLVSGPPETAPVSLTPHIWSLRDQWILLERWEDRHVRRICYIPALYSLNRWRLELKSVLQTSRHYLGLRSDVGTVEFLSLPFNTTDFPYSLRYDM
jgi:hypothetical protein